MVKNSTRVYVLKAFLVASTAIIPVASVSVAQAQTQARLQPTSFDIPAQSLSDSLAAFARATGLRIVYPAELAQGKSAPALQGPLTQNQALERLLSGSGLAWRFTGGNAVTIYETSSVDGATPVNTDGSLVLDTITISGSSGGNLADIPYETAGSSTYISSEQIERFRGTSPADILRDVPGLTTTGTRNGGSINANIRGMQDMDRAPIVVDGALQSQTEYRGYAGAANRSYIDPDLIGGVSVERGPSLGADASGATGGVVRMTTLKPEDILLPGKNMGIRLRGGYNSNSVSPPSEGSRGGASAGAQGNFDRPFLLEPSVGFGSIAGAYQDDRFEFLAAYSRRKQGNFFAGRQGQDVSTNPDVAAAYRLGEEVLNTSNDSASVLTKGALKFDGGHRLEFSFMRYDADYSEMLPSRYGLTYGGVPQNPLSNVVADTYTGTYTWNPDDNDLVNLRFNAWKTDVDQTIHAFNQFMAGGDETIWYDDNYNQAGRWGGSIENTSRLFTTYGDLTLNYGASFNHAKIVTRTHSYGKNGSDYGGGIGSDAWRNETSAFVSSQYRPFQWLKLDAGVRYTRTELHDNCPSGRNCKEDLTLGGWAPVAAVTVEPWQGLQGYVRYAEAIRGPSLYEQGYNNAWVVYGLDEHLRPEHAKNWEIGINVLRDGIFTPDDTLRFKAAWFKNEVDDYLTRGVVRGSQYVTRNLKRAMFEGIELSASYDNGRIFADAGYNHYLDNEFCLRDEHWPVQGVPGAPQCSSGGTANGWNLAHIPPRNKFSFTFGSRFFEERLTLGGRVSYVGKPLYQGKQIGAVPPPNWNPYTLVDLFASYKFNETAQLDFSVENVGDRFYIEAIEDGYNPGPGRTFRMNMTAKF